MRIRSIYPKYKSATVNFRKRGLSYTEIQEKIPVAKSTVSSWCRNVWINPKQKQRLDTKKRTGSLAGLETARQNRILRKKNQIKQQLEAGKKDVGKLNKRDRFIAGICLYAGEGGKKGKHISFANTDPTIIRFMVDWFKEFCKIPESKLRAALWIHNDLNETEAKTYWSRITNIPLAQFHKTYTVTRKTSSNKVTKTRHQHGVLSIRICSLEKLRLIFGWMSGIFSPDMI